MSAVTTARKPGMGTMIRESFKTMTSAERRRVIGMYGSIVLLHALGFAVFIAYVLPAHYKFFGIGLSITAYTLGLRHAFDADHISAIDNTTRKAGSGSSSRRRPSCPRSRTPTPRWSRSAARSARSCPRRSCS
jgi:hypothetical protein